LALERLFRRRRVTGEGRDVPNLWTRCPACEAQVYRKELEASFQVCPKCGHHLYLAVDQRARLLADEETFSPVSGNIFPADPIEFTDLEAYPARLARYQEKTGRPDAILSGTCQIGGIPSVLTIMDYEFAGGSMGSVVGEEFTRAAELALSDQRALVAVTASGGARMQEAALSLMQMAKSALALDLLREQGLPYVSILTDPTTGGVTASFATLADVILAEPGALIGFAGPRVIRQTIRQELPEGFQRAEFLLEHGMIDRVAPRPEQKAVVSRVLGHLYGVPHAV
jgi:acetyl-CoA carboxylase carboxyl transferase subunit beta